MRLTGAYLTDTESEALAEFKRAVVDLLGSSLEEFNRLKDEEWRIALDIINEGIEI